jgi:hypothetical protein
MHGADSDLSKAILAIEKKYGLTVAELSKILVDSASRILRDGIDLES